MPFRSTAAVLLLILTWVTRVQAQPDDRRFEHIATLATEAPFSETSYLTTQKKRGAFALVENGSPGSILVSASDHPGVLRTAGLFQQDLSRVAGQEVELVKGETHTAPRLIIVGTVGKSTLIDQLAKAGKLDVTALQGKWEQFLITPVKKPMPGVDQALVIVGSDKRGTIFGMFDLSEHMGVSPWHWWADAPVKSRQNIYVKAGKHTLGEPKVKYRGIFLNDEDPALGGWAREKFGGLNHQFYGKVFELILRLKGNYLWPAMWGKSLWDDDSLSAPLADEMGVVLATSHHEPLMRSHVEWNRYGKGAWNYETNADVLRQFWREGMERTQGQEKVVTLAMRGDGDEAMSEGTNIELLERIVEDQRTIIEDVTGKPARETPQVWALYKEVQDYYDKGMRVPDDVTLLLCDDNWGQVRILPAVDAAPRAGGYGMYYHFDFVGGPRSYKWLNTVQLERVWEQMRLTYEYGVKEIWLVNVGDLKPMDLPIDFFLDYAWNPDAITARDLPAYYTQWADQQFGGTHAKEIGQILALYTKYNARRKPELLEPTTYSLTQFNEAERVVEEYKELLARAQRIAQQLPAEAQDAFYQLVTYPVAACANLNEMYVAAGKNRLYRMQNRASTNFYADKVKELFFKDAELTRQHNTFASGKWNHIMEQTHMGHVSWSDPAVNKMPEVSYIQTSPTAGLGYQLESPLRPAGGGRFAMFSRSFTPFDPLNDQRYYVEVYNTGTVPLSYTVTPKHDWINVSSRQGTVPYEEKIYVSVDWSRVPAGQTEGEIVLAGAGREVTLTVPVRPAVPPQAAGFVENYGIVSIEAANFQRKHEASPVMWEVIPNLGLTGSAVTTRPVTAPKQAAGKDGSYLEYQVVLLDSGTFQLDAWFSPTLNFQKDEGLLYAFSIDGEAPQVMNLHEHAQAADWTYPDWWNSAVTNNLMKQTALRKHLSAGAHTLRYYRVDPGLVLQKIVLTKEGTSAESYLGPPQSTLLPQRVGR
ncbi:Glycosyl hydrolase family 115 [Catalinimonas alkaloidigena]|uniref:Glycosyl hydrolase family 115 n=1 Tax=Catalinimonas alkaloidigena TaxID=1075417 RepID=A0A1G9TMJ6_9BACT|nr:glycosyl hydrolase 115 family protein [Catalinimonas alkaloidigena]SDM48644.1 Glycosyl hydrolase family 115 [Catalinimonas alkaloidigena]